MVIDNFNTSKFYGEDIVHILTHFHSDHRQGLTSEYRGRLICSPVTSALVTRQLGVKRQFVESLEYNQHLRILPPAGSGLEPFDVIFVDANHCPGSVMVVLQGVSFATLYTGDARINNYVIRSVQALGITRIYKAYIDSTFYDETGNWDLMPTTYQSIDALISFLNHWKGKVALEFELLGTEVLIEAVLEHFPRQKIMVTDHRRLNELDIVFNSSPQIMSRLWVGDIDQSSCRFAIIPRDAILPKSFMRLRPSTQRWGDRLMNLGLSEKLEIVEVDEQHSITYLFFSFHSCKREIDDMVSILDIREVELLTRPIEADRSIHADKSKVLEKYDFQIQPIKSQLPFQFSCDGMWLETYYDSQETLFQGDSVDLPIILPTKSEN